MSAIQTIIETYLRFSDERALLALKAHRVRLLAAIDERDPFFRNLRSQCIDEMSAIEAGLAKFRRPLPTPPGANFANGGTKPPPPSADNVWPLAPANGSKTAEGALDSAMVAEQRAPLQTERASAARRFQSPAELTISPSDLAPLPEYHAHTPPPPSPEASAAEDRFPPRFSGMMITSSLIASWRLRLQEGPNEVEQDWDPTGFRGGAPESISGTLSGGSLFAGLHRFADIRFRQ